MTARITVDTPSMLPIFLCELEAAGAARADGDEVRFTIRATWCDPDEHRVGYAGVVRLMECVRELHWRRDVAPEHPAVDSITRSLDVEFLKPLVPGAVVVGGYAVEDVGPRSYVLGLVLREGSSGQELARGRLVSVFYDGTLHRAVPPPAGLAAALQALRAR